MKLRTAKTTIVAFVVLHNIAIEMKECLNFVQYRRRHIQRRQVHLQGGNFVKRNFIKRTFLI